MIMTVLCSCTAGTRGGRAIRTSQPSPPFLCIKCGSSMLPYLCGYLILRQIHKIYLFFFYFYYSFALFALRRLVSYISLNDSLYPFDDISPVIFFVLLIFQQNLGQFNLRHKSKRFEASTKIVLPSRR